MKIVIITDQIINGGGAGVIAWNQAIALHARGHGVFVVTTSEQLEDEGVKNENGIIIYTFYSKYRLGFRAYKSLNNKSLVNKVGKVLSEVKPDIVHAHNLHLHFSYASLVEAKKYAKAVFITIHDAMPFHYSKLFPETVEARDGNIKSYKVSPWTQIRLFKFAYNPFRNWIIKKYLKIPTKIFAVSGALAQALTDNGIENVEVLHNGIDVKEWEAQPNLNSDIKYIFFGGRLSAVKGGGVLIDAMEQVTKSFPNTFLLVVGEENDYVRKMQERTKTFIKIDGNHPHSEMKNVYARVSIVTAPSLCFDWFPTVVLEAMACKKPVIATCFGGSKEMVVDGKSGFIINPSNVNELTEKILLLFKDPNMAREMGNAGYERVKNEFSMEKHVQKLLSWYDKSLK